MEPFSAPACTFFGSVPMSTSPVTIIRDAPLGEGEYPQAACLPSSLRRRGRVISEPLVGGLYLVPGIALIVALWHLQRL